ncbi:MAG: hypothetical protein IGQ45_03910 [Cyanobacterium sp. T60_A2020_053]|nr:hypothetical protein [Cyanobacterium sp. T60_A2020_053]
MYSAFYLIIHLLTSIIMKTAECARCSQLVSLRYRIQWQKNQSWQLVCPQCWQEVAPDNTFYRYGGTWKGKKNK